MSKIIKASQVHEEEKLRQLFAEKKEVLPEQLEQVEESDPDVNQINVEEKAADLLKEAQQKADQIMEKATQEADRAKELAREAGYEEGMQSGYEEGIQKGLNEIIQASQTFIENLQRELERTQMLLNNQIEGLSGQIVQVGIQIASKVIKRQVQLEPGIIIDQVEAILQQISRVKSLAIRVHPSDIERVRNAEDNFLALTQGIDEIDFVIDHALEPGGCIIETDSGGVDASLQTQLEQIESALLEGIGDSHA